MSFAGRHEDHGEPEDDGHEENHERAESDLDNDTPVSLNLRLSVTVIVTGTLTLIAACLSGQQSVQLHQTVNIPLQNTQSE